MAQFNQVLQQQFDYSRNSIAWIEYDTSFDTIEIVDHDGNDMFLQGDDAHTLLDQARDMADNRFTEETFEDCLILCLYTYVDHIGSW